MKTEILEVEIQSKVLGVEGTAGAKAQRCLGSTEPLGDSTESSRKGGGGGTQEMEAPEATTKGRMGTQLVGMKVKRTDFYTVLLFQIKKAFCCTKGCT